MTSTTTTDELRAAALRIVAERGAAGLDTTERYAPGPYVEAHHVKHVLQAEGLMPEEDKTSAYYERERQLTRHIGQVKRVLDQLAKDGELLRFSSRSSGPLPQRTGQRHTLHGNTVGYIAPAVYAELERRCDAEAQAQAERLAAFDQLMVEAEQAGLPAPVKAAASGVTYNLDQLRRIIELCRS